MSHRHTGVAVLLALLASSNTHAQWQVIDSANLRQSIQQVLAWKRQYDQMQQQHQELKAQHAAMTGSRGLGMIATDPRLQSVVPADVGETFSNLGARGSSALTPAAQAIRQRTQIYDCAKHSGSDLATCQAVLSTNAQNQAYQERAMAMLAQRGKQIEALQARINTTTDPKSIAELQARLQVESAQVSNDTNKLMIMNALADIAIRLATQSSKEKELKNLAIKSNGLDTFVVRPYRTK
ncbi:MAG: type IV secretion system protein [Pseudomonadota bacterium]